MTRSGVVVRTAATCVVVIALAACTHATKGSEGQEVGGTTTGSSSATPAAEPVIRDARLVGAALGWALTRSGLYVTRDAGRAWYRWALGAPDQVTDIALLTSSRAMVATSVAGALTVRESNDGGRTWRDTRLASSADVAAAHFAYAHGRVAGLLVTRMSGSNFSVGDWYASRGTGAWRRRAAPAGGSVSMAGGAVWLAGQATIGSTAAPMVARPGRGPPCQGWAAVRWPDSPRHNRLPTRSSCR